MNNYVSAPPRGTVTKREGDARMREIVNGLWKYNLDLRPYIHEFSS
jgi:hypothetical protein